MVWLCAIGKNKMSHENGHMPELNASMAHAWTRRRPFNNAAHAIKTFPATDSRLLGLENTVFVDLHESVNEQVKG